MTPAAPRHAALHRNAEVRHGASVRDAMSQGRHRLHRIDLRSARMVLQAWLASRGLIALVALLLAVVWHRDLLTMLNNWDAAHFGELATGGYHIDPSGNLMAFFPGLPALLRLGLLCGVPTQVSGVILAAAGSAVAALAMIRLGGAWAGVAWLFAPTAVFTGVGYTESIFCAFAFWAWERARSGRWLAAALLAAGACTIRVSGLFLVGALFVMVVTTSGIGRRRQLARTGLLAIPAAVLAGYELYLHAISGSWTAWFHAQEAGWYRGFTWPWDSFQNTVAAIMPGAYADHPFWVWMFRGEMISMIVGLAVTAWCLTRRLWAEASFVAVQVLAFSLSYWFISVNRATLLWFPLWIMIGSWIVRRPRQPVAGWMHRLLVSIAATLGCGLMVFWSWLYFSGYWAS